MNKQNGIIALLLGIVLVVVLIMWQRDRESQDLNLDVDIGSIDSVTDTRMV